MEQTALTALHLGCGPGQPPWSKAYGRFGPKAVVRSALTHVCFAAEVVSRERLVCGSSIPTSPCPHCQTLTGESGNASLNTGQLVNGRADLIATPVLTLKNRMALARKRPIYRELCFTLGMVRITRFTYRTVQKTMTYKRWPTRKVGYAEVPEAFELQTNSVIHIQINAVLQVNLSYWSKILLKRTWYQFDAVD